MQKPRELCGGFAVAGSLVISKHHLFPYSLQRPKYATEPALWTATATTRARSTLIRTTPSSNNSRRSRELSLCSCPRRRPYSCSTRGAITLNNTTTQPPPPSPPPPSSSPPPALLRHPASLPPPAAAALLPALPACLPAAAHQARDVILAALACEHRRYLPLPAASCRSRHRHRRRRAAPRRARAYGHP